VSTAKLAKLTSTRARLDAARVALEREVALLSAERASSPASSPTRRECPTKRCAFEAAHNVNGGN
jgi:hypothetical protein